MKSSTHLPRIKRRRTLGADVPKCFYLQIRVPHYVHSFKHLTRHFQQYFLYLLTSSLSSVGKSEISPVCNEYIHISKTTKTCKITLLHCPSFRTRQLQDINLDSDCLNRSSLSRSSILRISFSTIYHHRVHRSKRHQHLLSYSTSSPHYL